MNNQIGHAVPLLLIAGCVAVGCGDGNTSPSENDIETDSTTETSLPEPRFLWDWTGIIGTGQSLSVGAEGTPILSTEQRYDNLKLSLGEVTVPPWEPENGALEMTPLVEPIRPVDPSYPSPYPSNIDGESPHTAMGNQISALVDTAFDEPYITAHSVIGESGQAMSVIGKGAEDTGETGRAYAATLFEVEAITRLAAAEGASYGIGAIVLTHGETDSQNPTYEAELVQLSRDYNEDLPALTGQTEPIPLFVSQQHSSPIEPTERSLSTVAAWRAGVDHPEDIVCTGPKYQYPYDNDATHLTSEGYRRLGEKIGQIFYEKVVLGRDWQPLQPTDVTREESVIRVTFNVPVPPLVWDDTLPEPHRNGHDAWADGKGFEVWTDTEEIVISGVEIVDDDTVAITCDGPLPDDDLFVGYAMYTDGPVMPNITKRWGLLRDSDPFVGSETGVAQPNYGVAFELSLP